MTYFTRWFLIWAVLYCAGLAQLNGQHGSDRRDPGAAEQLLAMANQSRGKTGAGPLAWDPALATAARKHCERMVAEGPISHRYGGEPELSERASLDGAHFGLIEENIAVGANPAEIHEAWMNSPGHRRNLLSTDVDHVGIAVIARGSDLYAVADYERAVAVMSPSQVEAHVAELLHKSGMRTRGDSVYARATCRLDSGFPHLEGGDQPGFVMRWQGADVDHLPQQLVDRMSSRRYLHADVGSCPARGDQTAFTQYRIAVLLY